MVPRRGIEPPACGLGNHRSVQLSYRGAGRSMGSGGRFGKRRTIGLASGRDRDKTARMDASSTSDLIRRYYDAFNRADMPAFLALLTDDVAHDINQGGRETGKTAFARFMERMNASYRERIADLQVFASADGTRAAAEFIVHGEYLRTDEGLPPARGQKYTLPAGAFFDIREGKVARVSNFYNLPDWIRQVS